MKKILMSTLCIMATLRFVNAGPSEKVLASGPWDGKLLIQLRDSSAEKIAQKLETISDTDTPGIGASHLAVAQSEDNEFSLVDWFFFGGECFDGYILYNSISQKQTDTVEAEKYKEIADRYYKAYSKAKAQATELAKSSTPIMTGVDNSHLVKYFLMSWLDPENSMQIDLGVWRQYKGAILVALTVYYNAAVDPKSCTPDETNVQFYKNYARTIKTVAQPQL
ncbi:MAG: hypothetical protein LBE99_03545 [Puniceicoccales bacterium]|jgi:hypothetical protein|nr:hypothetical protein [Puniceicoccales bacterium]